MVIQVISNNNEKAWVSLEGELDTLSAPLLVDQVSPLLGSKKKELAFDFTNLTFVSSAGLRALLLLNKKAKAAGGNVVILGMNDMIKQVFIMTGFSSLFVIE